jgi:hypothetical protein
MFTLARLSGFSTLVAVIPTVVFVETLGAVNNPDAEIAP